MVAVAAVMGVLVAGLAIPFAAVTGLSTRTVAEGMDKIPADLTAEPLAQRTRLLGRDGAVLATLYDQNRVNVPLAKVAPIMRKAMIAIEDYRFYQHGALDLRGTLRAFVTNQASGGATQGGSSITQQMVKMTLVNQAKTKAEQQAATADTYQRKINELRYAIAFEEKYSKDWILERYLNIAYFGDGAYGIEAASRHYFSKPAADLTLRQAACSPAWSRTPPATTPPTTRTGPRSGATPCWPGWPSSTWCPRPRRGRPRRPGWASRSPRPATAASRRRHRSSATTPCSTSSPTGASARPSTTAVGCCSAAGWRSRPRSTSATSAPRTPRSGATSTPPTRPSAAWRWSVPGTGEVRGLGAVAADGRNKKKGETYLNYVVPKQYGDANGFQAGSTFKAFVLSAAITQGIPLSTQISAPQTISIPENRYRVCNGKYLLGTDVWSPENSTGAGTFDLYTRYAAVGEHLLRPARGAHRSVRAHDPGEEDGVTVPGPRRRRAVHAGCHRRRPAHHGRGLRDLRRPGPVL